jgi:hypothetical protein
MIKTIQARSVRVVLLVGGLTLLGTAFSVPALAQTTTTLPDPTTTTSPGATTTVPGATTTVPGATTTVPGATTTVPGATTTVPGATTTVPGVTTTVPGATTTVPGVTTTVPGATTTVPGVTTTVPGVTTTALSAQTGSNAQTGATVGGSVTAPTIECAWALNDANHDWANRMQYGNDDTPTVGAGSPCVDNLAGAAKMTSNPYTTKVIDVKPNAHDLPTQQYVELWGGVTSNNANPIVYFDVFHPDGTLKVQIDASKYADSSKPANCEGPAGMFAAAQITGQLTSAATANMIAECQFQQKSLWYGAFGISKHQPNGMYKVDVHAAAAGGAESVQTFFVNVQGFMNLEKDFTNVNFGSVGPNSHYTQVGTGNFNFEGADLAGNQLTSVRNTGNTGVALGVKFASMCLASAASCTEDKRIDHFDAKFGVGVLPNLQTLGNTNLATALLSDLASSAKPAPLGPQNDFDLNIKRTLCPNDVGKLEFSIWTENIQAGTYNSGSGAGIQLVARPNPICPTDDGKVYPANLGTPQFGNPITPISATHWA